MILPLFSVKDKKIGFMNPWLHENENAAKRDFGDAINDPASTISKHPYDMELWKVGTWNDKTAEITAEAEYLASGIDYYKEKTNISEKIKEEKKDGE